MFHGCILKTIREYLCTSGANEFIKLKKKIKLPKEPQELSRKNTSIFIEPEFQLNLSYDCQTWTFTIANIEDMKGQKSE